MKRRYLTLFSLGGLIFSLDQLSKHLVEAWLPIGKRLEMGLVVVTQTRHPGMVFGLLKSAGRPLDDVLMTGIPLFAIILIVLIFIKMRSNEYLTSFALMAILTGALGNLLDRVRSGFVLGFLEVGVGGWRLPSFNVADVSIVVGVLVLFFHTLHSAKQPPERFPKEQAP